ncbi:MAG: ParB/RepB/Spo0J family partition protein, partial [Oscillospiraceae bacterium]
MKTRNKVKTTGQIYLIPQENIAPNPNQPRKRFDYEELEGLAQSIRINGILQPITVRQLDDDKFELVAGERRLRAARLVGLTQIPSIVTDIDAKKSAVFSLLDLDFFEEAEAIEKLIGEFSMSQDEIGKRLGKAQSTLSNKLRLLRLPEEMRYKLAKSGLTERHARALLSLPDDNERGRALSIMIDRHLNVAESERLIDQMLNRNSA